MMELLEENQEWLKAPARISYKVAVLMYQCQHGLAPTYVSDELRRPVDTKDRRRLRSAVSASSTSLVVRRTRMSAVGDRAFPIASARLWNSLPFHHPCYHCSISPAPFVLVSNPISSLFLILISDFVQFPRSDVSFWALWSLLHYITL